MEGGVVNQVRRMVLWSLVVGSLVLASCSNLSHKKTANYRDSELHLLNPAPAFLAPQSVENGKDEINSLHLQSKADYHFTLGEAYSLEGLPAKAIEEFKLARVYDQSSIIIRMRIAAEYSKLGLLAESLEIIKEVLEADPNNLKALMLQGSLFSALKLFENAFETFDQVTKLYPDQLDAQFLSGALAAELENYKDAVNRLEALAKNPDNREPEKTYFYLGRLFMERKDGDFVKQAQIYLQKAIHLKPRWVDPYLNLAQIYQQQSKMVEALELLEKYQEEYGPSVEVAQFLSRSYLAQENFLQALPHLEVIDRFEQENYNVKIQIALIFIEQERYPEAAAKLREILSVSPELDKVQYYLGAVYEQMERSDLAMLHYQKVPPRSAYYADASIHWAHLLHKKGDTAQSLNVMKKAVERRSDLPALYSFYASLLEQKKDYLTAVEVLKDAVKKFPKHVDLHFLLGTVFDRLERPEKTIESMEAVIALNPDHVQALNYLAYTFAELNRDLDRAEKLVRKALSFEPNDGYILDTLGWILFKKGEYENAIKYLEQAHRLQPEESIIAEHLGDAYYRLQMPEKAIRLYSAAVTLEKDQKKSAKIEAKIASIEAKNFTSNRGPASQRD